MPWKFLFANRYKAACIAVLVHSIGVLFLLKAQNPKPQPLTQPLAIELVTLPNPVREDQVQTADPEPEPAPSAAIPEPKELEILIPVPQSPPATKETSKPIAKPIKKSQPPAPQAAAKPITYAEFLKKKQKNSPTKNTPSTVKPTPLPKLDKLSFSEMSTSAQSHQNQNPPSNSQQNPSAQALALLRAHIDAVWQKPLSHKALSAKISFEVSPLGQLHGLHFEASSGHADFDASIQKAIARVHINAPTQALVGNRFVLTFKSGLRGALGVDAASGK